VAHVALTKKETLTRTQRNLGIFLLGRLNLDNCLDLDHCLDLLGLNLLCLAILLVLKRYFV